ncbi:unnamed protein product [Cuscuta europaea]
MSASS